MNEKRNQLIRKIYTPFGALFVWELIFHIFFINTNLWDDLTYAHCLDNTSLWAWSLSFYSTWSSRVIISGTGALLTRFALLWKILDSAMIVLLAFSISKLFLINRKRNEEWIVVGVFLLYPLTDMSSAGWIMTSITYLWPVSAGLYCCTLLKEREKLGWTHYLFCGIAALYASNAEQLCVVLLVILLAIACFAIRESNMYLIPRIVFLGTFVVGNLALHLTCPGNQRRLITEIGNWYPDFRLLTIIEKLQLGFSETMSMCLFAPNLIFLLLSGVLSLIICLKFQDVCCRAIAIIPFTLCLGVGFCSQVLMSIFPDLSLLAPFSLPRPGIYGGFVTLTNFRNVVSYIPLVVLLSCMVFCAVGIYISIEDKWWSILSTLIYLCGIGSGMIMGFSPTIYASSDRPFINTYFCFISVIIIILSQNRKTISDRLRHCISNAIFIAAGFNTLSIIIYAANLLAPL